MHQNTRVFSIQIIPGGTTESAPKGAFFIQKIVIVSFKSKHLVTVSVTCLVYTSLVRLAYQAINVHTTRIAQIVELLLPHITHFATILPDSSPPLSHFGNSR